MEGAEMYSDQTVKAKTKVIEGPRGFTLKPLQRLV